MDTIQLHPDFKEFLRLLNTHHVEYLLIGGYAVGYYGHPRATVDLDVWIAISAENVTKLLEVLKAFGFYDATLTVKELTTERRILRMGLPPYRIEVLNTISGVEFEKCYAKRVIDTFDGVQVNIISLEHLKHNKRASGRHKDLADLENLS